MKIKIIESNLKIEKNIMTHLKYKLKSLKEKNLGNKLKLERKKNNDLVIQFIKNKQLEKEIEIRYDNLEDKYQKLFSKTIYLQKQFEEEINNKEIDNYEKKKIC